MRTRHRPMRPIPQILQPTRFILGQPRMQRLARHTPPGRHLRHRATLGDHRQHRLIPLLTHTHLPHRNECQGPTEAAVKHQPKQCQPSTDTQTLGVSRSNTRCAWGGWVSNPRPRDYESPALTTELPPPTRSRLARLMRAEALTHGSSRPENGNGTPVGSRYCAPRAGLEPATR